MDTTATHDATVPKLVFIVPYRDRVPHKTFFTEYMTNVVMRDFVKDRDYSIYFVHQTDTRPFNRGAMKNIGFLAIKYRYPIEYKTMTFVFNDVDTVPYTNGVIDYETSPGIIKHFYGFNYALGGMFSIKGSDFERIGGFPNFWAWGCEDNCIYDRAIAGGIFVDRSTFFPIGDQRILQLYDGVTRNICRTEALSTRLRSTPETVWSIRNLAFDFKDEYINVLRFDTTTDPGALILETQNIMIKPQIDLTPIMSEAEISRRMKLQQYRYAHAHTQHQQLPKQHLPEQQLPQPPPRQPTRTPMMSLLRRPFVMSQTQTARK
jgi:hypothetical protein